MRRTAWFLTALSPLMAFALVSSAEDPQPDAAVPDAIPAAAKSKKNPVPATPQSIEHGGSIFATQCTMCHGARGDGSGDLAAQLELAVPDFTRAERQKKYSDGELFYIITQGHGRMPGDGERFPEKARWDMINYVRSLAAAR